MDIQEQLFGLMAVAEEHQKAVKAALDGLVAERAAIAKERAEIIPVVRQAVSDSVGRSFVGASDTATKALENAVGPVIGRLSAVVRAASEAEDSLKNAGRWFAWKWVILAAGGLVGVCLVAYASLTWQVYQVKALSDEKASLTAEIAQLQANVSALEKKGGRIVMAACGERLCIEANSNQGENAIHWQGPWKNANGVSLVIPNGY